MVKGKDSGARMTLTTFLCGWNALTTNRPEVNSLPFLHVMTLDQSLQGFHLHLEITNAFDC
jgi:hypothetical protein